MPHTICTAILTLLFSASFAHAQTRTYSCAKGNAITLTVIAPNAIKAGPIEGGTMRLKQSPGDPLRFSHGDYVVQISPDQSQITVEIPDWGSAKCSFRPQAAAQDGRAGLGNADPCGPGFHQAPQTDRCERVGTMDGYDWFKIEFHGRIGYQWGGIMCSDQAISGILEQCK